MIHRPRKNSWKPRLGVCLQRLTYTRSWSSFPSASFAAVSACTDSDLQTTFTKYPGGGIAYHNIEKAFGISLNDCLVWCRDYPSGVCRNIEYGGSPTACGLHYDTALAEPADWESGLPDWDFYQKDCA